MVDGSTIMMFFFHLASLNWPAQLLKVPSRSLSLDIAQNPPFQWFSTPVTAAGGFQAPGTWKGIRLAPQSPVLNGSRNWKWNVAWHSRLPHWLRIQPITLLHQFLFQGLEGACRRHEGCRRVHGESGEAQVRKEGDQKGMNCVCVLLCAIKPELEVLIGVRGPHLKCIWRYVYTYRHTHLYIYVYNRSLKNHTDIYNYMFASR